MPEQILGELPLKQILVAISIFIIFVGLAWLFHVLIAKVARRIAQKTRTKLDDILLSVLEKPAITLIVLSGLYLSLIWLPLEARVRSYVSRGFGIALSLLGIYVALSLIDTTAGWFGREAVGKRVSSLTKRLLWLFRAGTIAAGSLVAIIVILGVFGIGLVPLTDWLGTHGWRIGFIIILSMAGILSSARFIPKIVESTVARRAGEEQHELSKRTDTLSKMLVNVVQILALTVSFFMILSELEIDIAPILAGIGVAGVAFGFGAQGVIKDFLGGLFIIMESQYHVGDVIKIADIWGVVENINLRRTILRDLDGTVHVVPNGEIRVTSNYTKDWSRANVDVTVAYGEDVDHVMSVINRVGKELAGDPAWAPRILTAPQALRVDNLGSSGVQIKILGDTKPIQQWNVMGELRRRLKNAFDEEGIEIAWPHTKVYFGNTPPFTGREKETRGNGGQ